MAITNQIAEFGKRGTGNAGAGIGYGLQAQQMRNQNQRYQNELARMDAEKKQQNALLAQKQERQYLSDGVRAILSAPPEHRPNVYQGWLQEGMKRGVDLNGVPPEYSEPTLMTLAGAAGVDMTPKDSKLPANIQEWQAFQQMAPDQQERYLQMKRADKFLNLGGNQVRAGQMGGVAESYPVTPKPSETPEFQAEVTAAKEGAKIGVEGEQKQKGAEQRLEKVQSSYDALKNADLDLIYGRGESLFPDAARSQKGIDLIAQRDKYVATLRLAEVGQLKGTGPITENEQKMLAQAATVLMNPNISPALAKQAVDESWAILMEAAGREGASASSAKNNDPLGIRQ